MPASATSKTLHNVVYSRPNGTPLRLDVFIPQGEGPFPVVIYIHGGGWHSGDKRDNLAGWLVEHGYAVVNVNYRLSTEGPFPAQIHDCKAAVRWVRATAHKMRFDADRIGALGDSAGGHLAALLGTSAGVKSLEGKGGHPRQSSRIQAVCDFFGPTELVSAWQETTVEGEWGVRMYQMLLGGTDLESVKEQAQQASPVTYVTADDPPFLILHGTDDEIINVRQSRLLHEALKEKGVSSQLRIFEGHGHGGPWFYSDETRAVILDFFGEYLKKNAGDRVR